MKDAFEVLIDFILGVNYYCLIYLRTFKSPFLPKLFCFGIMIAVLFNNYLYVGFGWLTIFVSLHSYSFIHILHLLPHVVNF